MSGTSYAFWWQIRNHYRVLVLTCDEVKARIPHWTLRIAVKHILKTADHRKRKVTEERNQSRAVQERNWHVPCGALLRLTHKVVPLEIALVRACVCYEVPKPYLGGCFNSIARRGLMRPNVVVYLSSQAGSYGHVIGCVARNVLNPRSTL